MTNKYEDDLIAELRDNLGDDICKADWDEFWGIIRKVDECAAVHARIIKETGADDRDELIEEAVELVYEWAFNTRADLPSIKAYIWQQIENEM